MAPDTVGPPDHSSSYSSRSSTFWCGCECQDDIVFSVGALAFAWFVVSLWVRTRREPHEIEAEDRKLEVAPSKRAA